MNARDETLRCERNGKPCGTDSFREGQSCECANCRKWMASNALMIVAGRTIAPQVNLLLAALDAKLAAAQEQEEG